MKKVTWYPLDNQLFSQQMTGRMKSIDNINLMEEIEPTIFSVSEITTLIKQVLDNTFPSVWIEGELSNFKHHSSGHMYFTLKDEESELKGVMFRGYNRLLHFKPENGMKVLIQGGITVYAPRGNYQIVVQKMQPAGLGTLYLAFEALKKSLDDEGLFDVERKVPLPPYPFRVGVITSETGAAIQDIIDILTRRVPHIEIIFRPTLVQGNEATEDIVSAISEFEQYKKVDVLIIGRGGGSLEDLWPFNEEKVARSIVACPIPIISAVGHETDFTIADFVADLRAPTPSAAAELVSRPLEDIVKNLTEMNKRIMEVVQNRIEFLWQQLDALSTRYGFQQPSLLVKQKNQKLTELEDRLTQRIQFILSMKRTHFEGINRQLVSASPRSVLNRGYSIVYSIPDRQIIHQVEKLKVGKEFGVVMSDGEIVGETKKIEKKEKKRMPIRNF